MPPHAISPAVYYAAASLSAAKSVAETTRSTWSPAGNSRIEMPGGHQGNRRGTGAGILTIELPSDSTAHQRAARIDRSGIRGARYAATTNLGSAARRDKTCSNRSVRTVSKKASQTNLSILLNFDILGCGPKKARFAGLFRLRQLQQCRREPQGGG